MTHATLRLARLALTISALLPGARAQELVPAGTINAAGKRDAVFIVQDEPGIARFAEQVRRQFFASSRTVTDAAAAETELKGSDLIVYGTPANAWLAAHADRLPFRFHDGVIEIEGREFRGEHLRVICAIRNPQDLEHHAVIYAAEKAADVVGINGVFHGPTEWLVADGNSTLASGSFGASRSLAKEQQRADLEFLRVTIAEVHPATAAAIPADLTAALAKATAALAVPHTRAELWQLLQPVLLSLHDAHSSLAPPQSGTALALPLVWLADGLHVRADRGELRAGDKVLAIGGKDEAALLAALSAVVAAENAHWLKAHGESLLSDLGVLQALGLASAAPVRVRIDRDGATSEVAVPLAGREPPRHAERWVRFDLDPAHDLAVFTLDSCVVDQTYRDTLDELFTAVAEKGIGRIAVDLRQNGGGNSQVLDEFLRYVDVDGYLSFGGEVRMSAAVKAQRGASAAFAGSSASARRRNVRRSTPPPFHGQLSVLVGKHTFSSGNWFAVVVQDNKLGKVVGEPTGNAPSSFGDILSFTLPQSGLSFTLSYKKWLRPDPRRDPADTLTPDVLVPVTRQDLRTGSDPVLEYLRQQH
ncbi:MAG TPA: S41 family peptidase [Planctomycetota bacterium]|nr:S41 family peptidase [Planctomycetota bacterium]